MRSPEFWNRRGRGKLPGHLGMVVDAATPGELRAHIAVRDHHLAPNGFLNAGTLVTLADTCCGYGCVNALPALPRPLNPASSSACPKQRMSCVHCDSATTPSRCSACRRTSPCSIRSCRRSRSRKRCWPGPLRPLPVSRPSLLPRGKVRRFPATAYLAPDPAEPFVALTEALARAFPAHPPFRGEHATIVPHLTVAHGSAEDAQHAAVELEAAMRLHGPVRAWCGHVSLLESAAGRWREMHRLPLSSHPGA